MNAEQLRDMIEVSKNIIKRIEDLEAVVDTEKLQRERDQREVREESAYENRRGTTCDECESLGHLCPAHLEELWTGR